MPPDATTRDLTMTSLSFIGRSRSYGPERTFTLHPDSVAWQDRQSQGSLAFTDVHKIHVFKERFFGSSATYWACVLTSKAGAKLKLGAAHRAGFRSIENRTNTYIPFIKELESRLAAANPEVEFAAIDADQRLAGIDSLVGSAGIYLYRSLTLLGRRRAMDTAGFILRRVGPFLRGHRVAREQLSAAFPEKSPRDIDAILNRMWDSFGRTIAEYNFHEDIWPSDSTRIASRAIDMDAASTARWEQFGRNPQPMILCTGHLGPWELGALAGKRAGWNLAVLFRPSKFQRIGDALAQRRGEFAEEVIPAGPDLPLRVRAAIRERRMLAMLVDEHFADGVEVMFFGRPCKVTPLPARLARTFDLPIYVTRVVRMPDYRYRFDISDPLELPRDSTGKVDVAATMQVITAMTEQWIAEHPEQWMWFQRRWR